MAVELATAYLSLVPSLKGAGKTIGKELGSSEVQSEVESAGQKTGGGWVKGMGKVIGGAALAGVGIAAGLAIKGGLDRALSVENAEAKLRGLGNSAGDVSKIMDNALASVKGTAFGMGEAATTAAGAVAAGVKPGADLERTLKLVADAATIAGTDMGSMGTIFNKVGASNKIQGDVIAQLGDQGIPILQFLASEMGVTAEAAADMASKGEVDFDTFRNAMEKGLGGAALASGDTTQGAMKNMMASLSRAGESFLSGVFPMFKDGFTGITGFLDNLGPVAERAGEWFGNAINTAKDILTSLFDLVIKGDFTTKFRETFNMDEDSGVVTFLLNMRDTAITVFNEVKGGITAFVAAFQDGGSDVTSSGFAGVLERLGLAARAAFDYVTGTVIPALQATAGWIMRNKDYLLPLVVGITAMVVAYKAYTTAMTIWAGIQKAGIAIQIAWNAVLAANPIGIIILAIAGLVAALVWFFTQTETGKRIVQAAWSGIQSAISAVASWWTGTAWPAIKAVIDWFGMAFQAAGIIISNVWKGIQSAIQVVWNWIKTYVFDPIKWWLDVLGIAFGIYRDLAVGAFNAVKSGLSTAWSWINSNVFDPFKAGVALIGVAFESVRDVIGRAWDALKEIAAKPVNFILGTVYNDGIREWWNKISGAVGLDSLALPKASLVKFASGGVLPGYTPGRDVHQFYSPTGGRLALSGGEAIMRPEFTRAVGGAAGVARLNAAARGGQSLAFANGGVWDFFGDAWDSVKGVGKGIWDAAGMGLEVMKDPLGAIKRAVVDGIINPLMSKVGVKGDFVKILTELPVKFAGGLADKVKAMVSAKATADASSGPGWNPAGGGLGWQRMFQLVSAGVPGVRLNSSFRPGAITAVGTPSMHGAGRAIDISPSMAAFNWIKANFPDSKEIIYSPANGAQVYKGRNFMYPEPTRSMHFNHVHWGYKNGGVLGRGKGTHDKGGWVPDGGMALNLSGRPEAVLDPDESAALKAGLGGGPLVNQLIVQDEHEAIRELEAMTRRSITEARLRGVRR